MRNKFVAVIAVLALFALAGVQLLAFLEIFSISQLLGYYVWLGALFGLLVTFLKLNAGISYYVTNKRVAWSRRFYRWNKTVELPLESVISVRSIRIKGYGYLSFEYPIGKRAIIFRRFKDDPERVKELVLQAKPNVS